MPKGKLTTTKGRAKVKKAADRYVVGVKKRIGKDKLQESWTRLLKQWQRKPKAHTKTLEKILLEISKSRGIVDNFRGHANQSFESELQRVAHKAPIYEFSKGTQMTLARKSPEIYFLLLEPMIRTTLGLEKGGPPPARKVRNFSTPAFRAAVRTNTYFAAELGKRLFWPHRARNKVHWEKVKDSKRLVLT